MLNLINLIKIKPEMCEDIEKLESVEILMGGVVKKEIVGTNKCEKIHTEISNMLAPNLEITPEDVTALKYIKGTIGIEINNAGQKIEIYAYNKASLKKELEQFADENKFNESQKEYFMEMYFYERVPWNIEIDTFFEDLEEKMKEVVAREDIRDMIKEMGIELNSIPRCNLSLDILDEMSNHGCELIKVFEDKIKVEKVSNGYKILFSEKEIVKIKYEVEFVIA